MPTIDRTYVDDQFKDLHADSGLDPASATSFQNVGKYPVLIKVNDATQDVKGVLLKSGGWFESAAGDTAYGRSSPIGTTGVLQMQQGD